MIKQILFMIIMMIKAMRVERNHGAVGGSTARDPDAAASEAEKPAESNGRKRRDEEAQNYGREKKDS